MNGGFRSLTTGVLLAGFAAGAFADGRTESGAAFGTARRFGDVEKQAMALAIEGDRLYAGAGDSLYVFSLAKPLEPELLGQVSGVVAARQVAVQNAFAYVTAREGGLWIVDCTDPAKPRIRSRFDTCELATGVDVAGDVCFCGQRQNGVEFIDISDPDRPRHIAMRKTGESQSVLYRDGWLYSGEWGVGQVTVFDAHDMRNVREVTRVDLHGYGDGLWMQGDTLFAARGHHSKHRKVSGGVMTAEMKRYGESVEGGGMGHGLDVFDIADPASPKRVGELDYPPFYLRGLDMWTVRTSGGLLVAAQTHNGLFAVDISDRTAPKVLDRWTCPNPKYPDRPSDCVGSVAIGDGAVYAAVNGAGLFVLPCARARKVTFEKGRLPINASFREPYPVETDAWHVWKPKDVGQCRALALKGDVVYAACGDAGLYALRILPENAGFEELAKLPRHERVYDACVKGDRLYTAEGTEGFGVYDVSGGPADFREIARLPRVGRGKGDRLALYVNVIDDKWAVFSTRRGIDLYDISAFPSFRRVLHTGGCPGWDKYLQDRAVGDGRYIAYNNAHHAIVWFDLGTNPPTPRSTERNRISLSNGVCAFRDDVSLVSERGKYCLLKPGELDPADGGLWPFRKLPEAFPGERGQADINGIPRSDGRSVVFLSRITRRGALYDFTDAENPKLVRSWKFSGNPDLAVFHDGKVLVPCGYEGVLLQK